MDAMDPSTGKVLFELNPRCQKMQEPSYVNLVISMYVGCRARKCRLLRVVVELTL